MRFIELTLKEGFFQKTVKFSGIANIIYSQNNTTGKTTFLRMIFYALGYPVPSTKGIKFDDMEFWLTVESNGNQYKLYRHNSYLSMDEGEDQIDYSLPTDFYEIHTKLTGCNNKDILDNLIGASYMDQEKGWTLLNRGKVIGNISFNIEALVRGLGGKECIEELQQLEAVKRLQKKYEYMHSVAEYQEAIHEAGEDIEYDALDEVIDRRLEVLRAEREPVSDELKQIKSILRKNKVLAEYIADMKLTVQSSSGEEIPVTRDTLVGFLDNNELLTARREMLAAELEDINRQISSLEKQKGKEEQLFNVQTAIEAFDSDIKKISVDAIATQRIIDQLKRERHNLQERIRFMTKQDNEVVLELHNCISAYAEELDVSETYVSPNKDYIFTNDLKSLSGTILHKIVFSFKLAYIKLIKEKTGIVLPIVLDSPTGREVEHSTVENMLKIIQRDFPDHQMLIASIHDYDLKDKKIIEFRDRIFSSSDLMKTINSKSNQSTQIIKNDVKQINVKNYYSMNAVETKPVSYVIKGGTPLAGEVEISGSRNAALPILSAAIMADEIVTLENIPDLQDIRILLDVIASIGAHVEMIDRHTVIIDGSTVHNSCVEYDLIKRLRASYFLLGALLGKYNNAAVPLPGGCNIGSRPIDQHLKGFKAIGVNVSIEHGTIYARCDHMKGAHILMDVVSVGATINIMIASSRAVGTTIIENAAKDPHVVDVANFLNSMGADIEGAGTDVIRIKGVPCFHGSRYSIVPDMMEAGTFMMAAAATKGDILIKKVVPKHMEAVSAKLIEIGCEIEMFDDSIRVVAAKRLRNTRVMTQPYPGFPSDMQPLISTVLALSDGVSFVTENIFENRFMYVNELSHMGASIKIEGNTAIISGIDHFTGARVYSPDLRAGAALVIAGLEAEGVTVIDDIEYILRGYEAFDEKLRNLGALIKTLSDERDMNKIIPDMIG